MNHRKMKNRFNKKRDISRKAIRMGNPYKGCPKERSTNKNSKFLIVEDQEIEQLKKTFEVVAQNIYNNCSVNFFRLGDKKVSIPNATALLVIVQSTKFMSNNQMIQLQQVIVLLVEDEYSLNGLFNSDQQDDNVLKNISLDYVFKIWLIYNYNNDKNCTFYFDM
ncbi:unnamed protein product [Paramecium sonneborni]|uniref:Uncharacterized protein n=1 Tax=Paramecium sonneborni TaxID=65129 RepID=A0A8S1R3V9_9CILI|nr:unnamed protein product [Paramecium sonneborni]